MMRVYLHQMRYSVSKLLVQLYICSNTRMLKGKFWYPGTCMFKHCRQIIPFVGSRLAAWCSCCCFHWGFLSSLLNITWFAKMWQISSHWQDLWTVLLRTKKLLWIMVRNCLRWVTTYSINNNLQYYNIIIIVVWINNILLMVFGFWICVYMNLMFVLQIWHYDYQVFVLT